jgi:hypothetical protein
MENQNLKNEKLLTAIYKLKEINHPHCALTGRPLPDRKYSTSELTSLYQVHGLARAKTIVDKTNSQVAPEWLFADETGLDNLVFHFPHEYVIYAFEILFKSIYNSQLEFENPGNTITSYELHTQMAYKIHAWEFLQKQSKDLIITLAELLRRILASEKPIAIRNELLKYRSIKVLTDTDLLLEFNVKLVETLDKIESGYYDKREVQKRIKAQKLFAVQQKIKMLSGLELAIYETLQEEFENIDDLEATDVRFAKADQMAYETNALWRLGKSANKPAKPKKKKVAPEQLTKSVANQGLKSIFGKFKSNQNGSDS